MNVLLLVAAIAGWCVAALAIVRWTARSRELQAARNALGEAGRRCRSKSRSEQAQQDADERVGEAEATQHWLVGALDQAADGDRRRRSDRTGSVAQRRRARTSDGARHGDVIAEDALAELLQHALERPRRRTRDPALRTAAPGAAPAARFRSDAEGEVIGAVAFTRDISEARRVESVRRDFVANVSHELKTPIGALGAARRDDGGHRRRRRDAAARRPRRARVRSPRAASSTTCSTSRRSRRRKRRRGSRSRSRCSSPRPSTTCRPRPTPPACRSASRPRRPTSRSRATTASCAARS